MYPAVAQSQGADSADTTPSSPTEPAQGFQWEPALLQSAIFLGAQHAVRMTQTKTRAELSGPFWSDYFDSVSSLHTWRDGDGFRTNYLAHPLMGAIAGDIEIFNDPSGQRLEFDLSSKRYWQSRLKAMAWSAAYSAQFEIGPISEASIGNVGIHPPTMAVVDLVVTPLGGFTAMLLEDYLDKRFVSRWELAGGVKARLYQGCLEPRPLPGQSASLEKTLVSRQPATLTAQEPRGVRAGLCRDGLGLLGLRDFWCVDLQSTVFQFRCNLIHIDGTRHLETPVDLVGTRLGPEHFAFLSLLFVFCRRVDDDFVGRGSHLDILRLKAGQSDREFISTVFFGQLRLSRTEEFALRLEPIF